MLSRKLREPDWHSKRKKRLSVKEEEFYLMKKLGSQLKEQRMKKQKENGGGRLPMPRLLEKLKSRESDKKLMFMPRN